MLRWPIRQLSNHLLVTRLLLLSVALFLVIVLARCSVLPEPPAWVGSLGYGPEQVFPIALDQFGGPVIPVFVNGHPAPLTFDTGNMTGLLLASSFADQAGLTATGQRQLYDSQGQPSTVSREYAIDSLEVFGKMWRDLAATEYAPDNLTGLIGPDYLSGNRFTIDYPSRLMAVGGGETPAEIEGAVVLPLVRSPQFERLLLVEGQINGRHVLMEIDTGKSRTCIDPELAESLALPEGNHGFRIDELQLGDLTFSIRSAKSIRFGALGLGLDRPVVAGIGADVLSQLRITVDYTTNQLIVERPQ